MTGDPVQSQSRVETPMLGSEPRSLTEPQSAILDAIAARLIPTDEAGPGAREARVTCYIERALASDYSEHLPAYVDGLGLTDHHAVSKCGQPFAELPETQQDAILADLEQDRVPGVASGSSSFFELVRRHVIEGMFGDPLWGGNADFVGWELLGYPGPRHVWTEHEQQLDVVVPPSWRSTSSSQVVGRPAPPPAERPNHSSAST